MILIFLIALLFWGFNTDRIIFNEEAFIAIISITYFYFLNNYLKNSLNNYFFIKIDYLYVLYFFIFNTMRYLFTHTRRFCNHFRIFTRFCRYSIGYFYWDVRVNGRQILKTLINKIIHIYTYIYMLLIYDYIDYNININNAKITTAQIFNYFSLKNEKYEDRFIKWFMEQPIWANFYVDGWELDQFTIQMESAISELNLDEVINNTKYLNIKNNIFKNQQSINNLIK